jgi:hypothetical protein
MYNEEFHNLCFRAHIRLMNSKSARITIRNARKILVREREGKQSLGRPRHRWENPTEILRELLDWTFLKKKKLNLTERPPLVGEVSADFCG